MELDLQTTPTVILSTPNAANVVTEKLVAELRRVAEDPAVIEAQSAFENAEARQMKLDVALRGLNARYGELDKWLKGILPEHVEALIEAAASGSKQPGAKTASRIIDAESEVRLLIRAVQRVVEHLNPTAQIACLQAEARYGFTRAKSLETLANERAQRLLESLSVAVSEEGTVQVDAKAGVSGVLLSMASEAKTKAYGHERLAKELQSKYDEQKRKR